MDGLLWKTLFFNGWLGGYHYFRKHPYYANAEMKRVQIPDVAVVAWRFWTTNRTIRRFIVEFSEIKLEKNGWFTTMWEYLGEFSPLSQNHVWCTTWGRCSSKMTLFSVWSSKKNTVSLDLISEMISSDIILLWANDKTIIPDKIPKPEGKPPLQLHPKKT